MAVVSFSACYPPTSRRKGPTRSKTPLSFCSSWFANSLPHHLKVFLQTQFSVAMATRKWQWWFIWGELWQRVALSFGREKSLYLVIKKRTPADRITESWQFDPCVELHLLHLPHFLCYVSWVYNCTKDRESSPLDISQVMWVLLMSSPNLGRMN